MSEKITRRTLITGTAGALAALVLPGWLPALPPGTPMVVYKDPNCGCCHNWVEIMRKAGFEVAVRDTPDMTSIKRRYQVGSKLASCHTAVVAGYVIEGHVPADLIHKLVRQKPKGLGLAVPGMPIGSPGMEGSPKEAYDVLLFHTGGTTSVYARR
jgi:hypothetical protein